jgi:hypothetical protein
MLFARLNENDAVVELRDMAAVPLRHFIQVTDAEGNVICHEVLPVDPEHPYDIPHKGIRWRPFLEEHRLDGFDAELHEQVEDIRVEPGCVRKLLYHKAKPAEAMCEKIRASYRDRIIDALPDMDAVRRLTEERDRRLADAQG